MLNKNKISFLYESFVEPSAFPQPEPIKKNIPYWFKALKNYVSEKEPTAKRCVPLLDALTTGYVLKCPVDILIWTYNDEERKAFCWKSEWALRLSDNTQTPIEFVTAHAPDQINTLNLVKQGGVPLKLNNFWGIKTPPGYSCLFTPVLNDDTLLNKGIFILSGIVHTDTYNSPVNFPFIFLFPRDTPVTIEKGTPLVQVIPFKREDWVSEVVFDSKNNIKKSAQLLASIFSDRYKKLFWAGKSTFN